MAWGLRLGLLAIAAVTVAACSRPEIPGARLEAAAFADLPGWSEDSQAQALSAFRRSCARVGGATASTEFRKRIGPICNRALRQPDNITDARARAFFERYFSPWRIVPGPGPGGADAAASGLATAYYEPEVPGSLTRTDRFQVPLYAPPPELASGTERVSTSRQKPTPSPTRGEIEAGVLAGRSLEIAWIENPVDAFFIQIQGSARLRLEDGSVVRVGYAGKNGHPYTAIGRVLVERGELPRSGVSMQTIRDWLGRQSPERARALMNEDRSYVFFRIVAGLDPTLGPVGAQTVPLTAGRSIAVDWRRHAYGTPFWVDTLVPEAPGAPPAPFRRLMVAQDTGGAIVGPARIDLFLGSGDQAGGIAGGVRAPVRLYLLWPKRSRK